MIKNTTKIRVRYGETDQMGTVNNAVYPTYYEIGRTMMFRELGFPYKQMEEEGVLIPLSDLYVKFLFPAYYDEELTLVTILKEMPSARIRFDYEVYNSKDKLINRGYSIQAFINSKTRRPMRVPQSIKDLLEPHFIEKTNF